MIARLYNVFSSRWELCSFIINGATHALLLVEVQVMHFLILRVDVAVTRLRNFDDHIDPSVDGNGVVMIARSGIIDIEITVLEAVKDLGRDESVEILLAVFPIVRIEVDWSIMAR